MNPLWFALRVRQHCEKTGTKAVVYMDGDTLKACYSRSAKYDRMERSTRAVGVYSSKLVPEILVADLRSFLELRERHRATMGLVAEITACNAAGLVLRNLKGVSAAQLTALKLALRSFNIQKGRFM